MDFSFIYDEIRQLYKPYGRESIDPVVLIKINKYTDEVIEKSARYYENELQKEISLDREAHGKKPLKESEKNCVIQCFSLIRRGDVYEEGENQDC